MSARLWAEKPFLLAQIYRGQIWVGLCWWEQTFGKRTLAVPPWRVRIFQERISPVLSGQTPAHVTLLVAMKEPMQTDVPVSRRNHLNQ
jgi:hypothetical protein